MTTLKICTVLIAKEDMQYYTKGKEYTILENDRDTNYKVSSNSLTIIHWFDIRSLKNNFTIKRYTLTDLREKKIAVFLKSKEEFERVSPNDYSNWMYDSYFGYEDGVLTFIDEESSPTYILLESIDEIDLEEKEESTPMYIAKLETEINRLDSEIARLKEENQQLRESTQISQSQQSERTRMAWELIIKNGYFYQGDFTDLGKVDVAINFVDHFLAKSKEVGNG